jgi:hypothetical protein
MKRTLALSAVVLSLGIGLYACDDSTDTPAGGTGGSAAGGSAAGGSAGAKADSGAGGTAAGGTAGASAGGTAGTSAGGTTGDAGPTDDSGTGGTAAGGTAGTGDGGTGAGGTAGSGAGGTAGSGAGGTVGTVDWTMCNATTMTKEASAQEFCTHYFATTCSTSVTDASMKFADMAACVARYGTYGAKQGCAAYHLCVATTVASHCPHPAMTGGPCMLP